MRSTKSPAKKTASKRAKVATKRVAKKLAKSKARVARKSAPAAPPPGVNEIRCKGCGKPESTVGECLSMMPHTAYQKRKASGKTGRKKAEPMPYVLKDTYLQVTIEGRAFQLDNSHPTFAKMAKALRDENWKAVPKLVSLAQNLISASHGNVEVKAGAVYYKGSQVDSSLTQRILAMIKENKMADGVAHMLKFMDNLYKNPSSEARSEFFDWLRKNDLPITDDGCFLAYKSVNHRLRDTHTDTIDNSPGQRIMGSRKWFDTSYRTQCSSGYHVCSRQYGTYGTRVMAVKVNPRDVLSAEGGKMRVVNYEVLCELGSKSQDLFKVEGFSSVEKQLVVEVKAERQDLIKMLLASKEVKRLIAKGKVKDKTIKGYPYARLKIMAQRYEVLPPAQATPSVPDQIGVAPLEAARKAGGFTVGQIAQETGWDYKIVSKIERELEPSQDNFDHYLRAIGKLKGVSLSRSAVSFPVATPAPR